MSITIGTQTIGGTSGGSSSGPAVVPLAGYSAIDATTSPAAALLAAGGAPLSVDSKTCWYPKTNWPQKPTPPRMCPPSCPSAKSN